jgi:enolase-phosphatase E1
MTAAVAVTLSADAVVVDIEGTTTPIAFVHDVLFPYARAQLDDFLAARAGDAAVRAILAALAAEHAADDAADKPATFTAPDYVRWLMDRDRKSTALKALQGELWRGGYESGALRSEVYADVPPALAAWRAAGLAVAIYSSGSIDAQRLLFAHTEHGDLTRAIDRYFDTTTGPKREAASYRAIATALGLAPARVVFVSDVDAELVAARAAGVQGVLALRPGNAAVAPEVAAAFPTVTSFSQLAIAP